MPVPGQGKLRNDCDDPLQLLREPRHRPRLVHRGDPGGAQRAPRLAAPRGHPRVRPEGAGSVDRPQRSRRRRQARAPRRAPRRPAGAPHGHRGAPHPRHDRFLPRRLLRPLGARRAGGRPPGRLPDPAAGVLRRRPDRRRHARRRRHPGEHPRNRGRRRLRRHGRFGRPRHRRRRRQRFRRFRRPRHRSGHRHRCHRGGRRGPGRGRLAVLRFRPRRRCRRALPRVLRPGRPAVWPALGPPAGVRRPARQRPLRRRRPHAAGPAAGPAAAAVPERAAEAEGPEGAREPGQPEPRRPGHRCADGREGPRRHPRRQHGHLRAGDADRLLQRQLRGLEHRFRLHGRRHRHRRERRRRPLPRRRADVGVPAAARAEGP